ncbi:hypothetical protein G3480_00505 [Thiorhodococcus mannitoliphagus]|uniref:Uncharacterized protein n=1 Tax=Thiorhodococcus mannitoliphagus TaxID=329406 RepID=A0A6P1DSY7_9GAMM|nr:hypothetical protein [Thiorhodococcus mannitoliphagus]NEX18815.1 hypothetical protein [Thiorhodococcus mannitoliphagus]
MSDYLHVEKRLLQSEQSALEKLLAEIPEDHVIERLGLESRKQEIEDLLQQDDAGE